MSPVFLFTVSTEPSTGDEVATGMLRKPMHNAYIASKDAISFAPAAMAISLKTLLCELVNYFADLFKLAAKPTASPNLKAFQHRQGNARPSCVFQNTCRDQVLSGAIASRNYQGVTADAFGPVKGCCVTKAFAVYRRLMA